MHYLSCNLMVLHTNVQTTKEKEGGQSGYKVQKCHRDVSLQYRVKGGRESDKQQRKSGKGGSEERMFGFLSPFILNTQSSEKR